MIGNPFSWIIWAFFENDDDPLPKPSLWPDKPLWVRKILWWIRNPFHNFTHYVIGIKGEKFLTYVEYNSGNWKKVNRVVTKSVGLSSFGIPYVKIKEYPCWYYTGNKWEGYFGWRSSGGFGISFRTR